MSQPCKTYRNETTKLFKLSYNLIWKFRLRWWRMPCAGCSVQELKKLGRHEYYTACQWRAGAVPLFPLLWQEPAKHRTTSHCQWFVCPVYTYKFLFSLWAGARRPCVSCPVRFSWLQFVTFSLASLLELESFMLLVLSRRLPLPFLQIVLLHNCKCGKAVKSYTSLERWAWNYQLVGEHWGQINRAQHPPVILDPSSSLFGTCSQNMTAAWTACHQAGTACVLTGLWWFLYMLRKLSFFRRKCTEAYVLYCG